MKKIFVALYALIYGSLAYATESKYDLTHPVCDIIKESVGRFDNKVCEDINASLLARPITEKDNQYCYHRAEIPLSPDDIYANDTETIQKPSIYALKIKAIQAGRCLSFNVGYKDYITGASRIRDSHNSNDFHYTWLPASLHYIESFFFELTLEHGLVYRAKPVFIDNPNQYPRYTRFDGSIMNQDGINGAQAIHFLTGYFNIFQCHPQAMAFALANNANANGYYRPGGEWYYGTPLDSFMTNGFGELEHCKETLKILLSNGANPNLTEQDRINAGCKKRCVKGDTELFVNLKNRTDVSDQFKHDIAEILAPYHTKSVPCLKLVESERYKQCPWLEGLL